MNRMWRRLSLQTRILVLLTALILTALAGGLVTVWHTDSIDSLLSNLIEQHMASFQAAEELETALVRQRGFVTYYFLDQNPEWLAKLEEYHLSFLDWLGKAARSSIGGSASPVAFICVPSARSASGNLSNGQRGILTTHVVQRGLEGGHGLAGHRVADLVQPQADRDLRRDPRDGIARSLGGQRRASG